MSRSKRQRRRRASTKFKSLVKADLKRRLRQTRREAQAALLRDPEADTPRYLPNRELANPYDHD